MRTFPWSLALLVLIGCGGDDAPAEGTTAGDCSDAADNDADGLFDCDDDGCAGSPDCVGTDENAAPSGAAIAIEPAAPADADDLRCVIVTEATDPNGDAVTYAYAWTKNGADAGLTTDTVSEALTTGGDTWTCTVTPTDGALSGAPASATVTVAQGNRAPSAPTVSISPAAPTDDDVLTCVIDTESVDPDGDTVNYSYAWSVDGGDAGITGATVNAALTEVGQQWTCAVTASDGELESGAASVSVEVIPSGCSPTGTYAAFETEAQCPIAHWDMSTLDTRGFIADLIGGNGFDAYGDPTPGEPGIIGLTYRIDSTSEYFLSVYSFDSRLLGSGQKSISLWAVAYSFSGDGDSQLPFFSFGAPYSGAPCDGSMAALYYAGQPKFAGCESSDLSGGGTWTLGEWHHLAAVYDGRVGHLYVDGIEVASQAISLDTTSAYPYFSIGRDTHGGTSYHALGNGSVDEIKVYDYALSTEQVEALAALAD
jgi:hypothetical protein